MILLMRNHCSNEFLPGCEITVVEIDAGLLASIRRRADAFLKLKAEDASLSAVRWHDGGSACADATEALTTAVTGDPDADLADWLEERGGWAVVPDLDLPPGSLANIDCPRMVVTANGDEAEVGWVYRVGSDEVVTAGASVHELEERVAAAGG